MAIERKTVYFEKRGPTNTHETLQLAKERAEALGIRDIIVASGTGTTGAKASKIFRGYNLVVVASVMGFKEPNKSSMLEKNRAIIEGNSGKIICSGHAFGMLGRAVNRKFGVIQVDELIAHVLRLICVGVKVCFEISCMAADAGLIKSGEEAITIGGSGGGADTAIVLKPSNTHTFFDSKFLEIICKPRE